MVSLATRKCYYNYNFVGAYYIVIYFKLEHINFVNESTVASRLQSYL